MERMLRFDEMITPKIITLVYWLALVGAVIGGVGTMFTGWGGFTISKLLLGLAVMLGGALSARISCELLIVLFKIHENIHALAKSANGGRYAA
jgi:hypothetical protein